MFHQKIKQCFSHSVHLVSSVISEFTYSDTDLTRNRKFPADKLITFLVSQGSSSTKNELLDFFDMDPQSPTASALNQQRAKLSPDALEAVFRHFNHFASFFMTKKSYATAFLLQMAPPLPFSVNLLSPQKSIMSLKDIQ